MEALKYFDKGDRVPALIFRRTYTELKDSGGLWEEAVKLFPQLGAEMVESKMTATFPSGYKIQFRHMQHDKDATKWNGKNIGDVSFDEGTFFTEFQFWTLLSCQRAAGQPRFRITLNPDPDSWAFEFIEPYLTPVGVADLAMSGKVRYFGRVSGALVLFDSLEQAQRAGVEDPLSYTFIAASLEDNKILQELSPKYGSNLRSLPPLEQARYLLGNWRIRAKAGSYFQSDWFPRLSSHPLERAALPPIRRWFWCMDLAGTPVEGDQVPGAPTDTRPADKDPKAKKSPDWSVILLMAQLQDGRLVVWDVWRYRDTPGAVEWRLAQLVQLHKLQTRGCVVVQWQDPAQAGIHQNSTYAKALRGGARLITTDSMNPELVARLASRAAYTGQILVREACTKGDAFMSALEGYPTAEHDDDVSALGLGVVYALESPLPTSVGAQRVPDEMQSITHDVNINPKWKMY